MWRNYYTHNFLSKTLYSVHKNKNGSVSVPAGKYHVSIKQVSSNTSLVNKDSLALISDSPSRRDSGEKIFLDLFSLFSDI